jgi:hypothetical protein
MNIFGKVQKREQTLRLSYVLKKRRKGASKWLKWQHRNSRRMRKKMMMMSC